MSWITLGIICVVIVVGACVLFALAAVVIDSMDVTSNTMGVDDDGPPPEVMMWEGDGGFVNDIGDE